VKKQQTIKRLLFTLVLGLLLVPAGNLWATLVQGPVSFNVGDPASDFYGTVIVQVFEGTNPYGIDMEGQTSFIEYVLTNNASSLVEIDVFSIGGLEFTSIGFVSPIGAEVAPSLAEPVPENGGEAARWTFGDDLFDAGLAPGAVSSPLYLLSSAPVVPEGAGQTTGFGDAGFRLANGVVLAPVHLEDDGDGLGDNGIPEPATLLLLGSGFLLGSVALRKRFSKLI
jgi:hypothetical protein